MKKFIFSLFLFLSISASIVAQTVYVTRTGAKYHDSGCRYLSRSCIPITLSGAISEGYTPCSICSPPTHVVRHKTKHKAKAHHKPRKKQIAVH